MPHAAPIVLTTPIALDRRALSQAWYSALHLAEHTAAPAPSAGRATGTVARARAAHATATTLAPQATNAHAQRGDAPGSAVREPADRRAPGDVLARKIVERLAARPQVHFTAIAFALDGKTARVLIRCDGTRVRLHAVCAPALRPAVERALQHARYALAGAGIATC